MKKEDLEKTIHPSLNQADEDTLAAIKKRIDVNKSLNEKQAIRESIRAKNEAKLSNKAGSKLSKIIGERTLKSIPLLGAAAGFASAGEAMAEGRPGRALAEGISAIDPTPISDVAIGAYDYMNQDEDNEDMQLNQDIENPSLTTEDRMKALRRARDKYLKPQEE